MMLGCLAAKFREIRRYIDEARSNSLESAVRLHFSHGLTDILLTTWAPNLLQRELALIRAYVIASQ